METEAYNMFHGDVERSSTIHISLRFCSLALWLNYQEPNPLDISYFTEVRKNSGKITKISMAQQSLIQ